MKISNIDVSSYPNSEKIYKHGVLFPELRVAMRRINQYPTVTIENGARIERANPAVTVYDTSGPYTDDSYPCLLYTSSRVYLGDLGARLGIIL